MIPIVWLMLGNLDLWPPGSLVADGSLDLIPAQGFRLTPLVGDDGEARGIDGAARTRVPGRQRDRRRRLAIAGDGRLRPPACRRSSGRGRRCTWHELLQARRALMAA